MYKIGIIGNKDEIKGFMSIGIDAFPVIEDEKEIKKTLDKLVDSNYAIIYITEKMSILVEKHILKFKERQVPAIITIPGSSGSMNLGMNKIRECAKKAIGIDVLNR